MRIGSLFSGYGGLDMAVEAVTGGDLAWVSDIDPGACKILAHHHMGVLNIGDVRAFDWSPIKPVDVLTAGYPCQPFSSAGAKQGVTDDRFLWPEVARAISALGPRLVVLENVRDHLVRGFPQVLGELAGLGYDASWTVVRASDVGACHKRARLFVVAHPNGEPWPFDRHAVRADRPTAVPSGQTVPGRRRSAPADSDGDGLARLGWQQSVERDSDGRGGQDTAWGDYESAVRRWEGVTGRAAPPPTEPNTRGGRRLAPAFVEWLMGLPAGYVTAIPGLTRNEQLKALGNGVVPQQATAALTFLLQAIEVAA